MIPLRWEWEPGMPNIPDLTPGSRRGRSCCGARFDEQRNSYACTRHPGHTGRHAAGAGGMGIVAVWP